MRLTEKLEEARRLADYWRGAAGGVDAFPWEMIEPKPIRKNARFMYVMTNCPECVPDRALVTCPHCGGLGRVRTEQRIR